MMTGVFAITILLGCFAFAAFLVGGVPVGASRRPAAVRAAESHWTASCSERGR
jgi:hypothetical protein